ncbi:transcriptional regulator [uncultured Bacteroides sp.]|uniref:type II restriction enzyme n=1 Tax=uncultured Bacteroides sp. TaxID=162156 RepID=UPI00267500F1|nr:transcriptional regulator [uncultured Bacteroides sp.]
MSKSKNDIAWEKIFEKYRILDRLANNERVSISSIDINQFREARLMTKFDHRSQLPKLFIDHKLSILPTSRGTYEIGTFETFCDFNKEDVGITTIDFPTFLESIDYKDITSESIAINCTFVSKILHDFTGEENLLPTVCGRMSSSLFDFTINSGKNSFKINVENSQIEIDGGYEGDNSLNLIEAKNYISDDFLIRQLYYPYRLWSNRITKRVRPIFLTYSNGIFHLREYEFTTPNLYNSIRLLQHKKYAVQEGTINIENIQNILNDIQVVIEPELPFPQADSFERVINLCELLKQRGFISKDDITRNYDFDHRQTDYYSNAAKYLGLIETIRENQQIGCTLTQDGFRIFNLPIVERQLEFVKLILSHTVFQNTLKLYFDKGNVPTKDEVVEIMKNAKLYNIDSDQTYKRRASTIISWINWILGLIE